MKFAFLQIIRFYRKFLSFDTGLLSAFMGGQKACRFTPTCSQYMEEAVVRYGIITGLRLGLNRIGRCHPWNKGGFDPVPNL